MPMTPSQNEGAPPKSPKLYDSDGTISSTSESEQESVGKKQVTDLTSKDPSSVSTSPAKTNISSGTIIVHEYIDDETYSRILEKNYYGAGEIAIKDEAMNFFKKTITVKSAPKEYNIPSYNVSNESDESNSKSGAKEVNDRLDVLKYSTRDITMATDDPKHLDGSIVFIFYVSQSNVCHRFSYKMKEVECYDIHGENVSADILKYT